MKQVLVGAAALILGVLVGAIYPLTEVRSLRDQVEELEERDCSPRMGSELARIFQGRPQVGSRPSELEAPELPVEPDTDGLPEADEGHEGVRIEVGGQEEDREPEDMDGALAVARQAMELRRVQARAALEQDAWPEEGQLQEMDQAIADMNHDLYGLTEELLGTLEERDPTRREMMIFGADVLDVLIEADSAIAGTFDAEQQEAAAEESLDPFSYVDPGLLDLLAELER